MKRSWKKQWINQLDKSIPDLREDVLNAPIPTALATKKEEEKSKTTVVNNTEKTVKERWSLTDKLNGWLECFTARLKAKSSVVLRMTASAIAVLAVCMVALEALPLGGGVENVSAYALEINPQAVFTTDGEGIVTAVVAGNADADVILSSTKRKSAMEGKPIDVAMEYFVDYAAKLGYLDLESGDAIRLSVCDEKGDDVTVRERLTSYFCEKGVYVAVLMEHVSVQSFCERIGGIFHSTLQKLVKTFEALPILYIEREASTKTVEELQSIYAEKVQKEEIKTTVEGLLNDVLEWITMREESLQEIDDLNVEIKEHKDNPAFLFKDYWSVKDRQNQSGFTSEFAALLEEMKSCIEKHEQTYRVKIESEFDLKTLQIEASSEYLHDLAELLADFSMEVFNGSTEFLSLALGWFGVDVDLAALCEQPTTKADYVEKTRQYNEIRYRSLYTQGRIAYEVDRASLSTEEYDAYIQLICGEYGSLEGYWTALNA